MLYECLVKKGHTGAGSFTENKIYVHAQNALEAMEQAMKRGGVKKGISFMSGQGVISVKPALRAN